MLALIIGPLAATMALLIVGLALPGLYTSGGGLLLAAAVAFWVGAGAAAWADAGRQGRGAAIVAFYIVALFATYLLILQSRVPAVGTSRGGPNVEQPR